MIDHDALRHCRVWQCAPNELCTRRWVSDPENPRCPSCHLPGEAASLTYGEALDAMERFGCDMDIHVAVPVPEVVPLSTLRRELWVGLGVFHPMSQEGDRADWLAYDVGIIVDMFPDPDFPGWQCRFIHALGGSSGTLKYRPDNLWVPRTLAERLHR